MKNIIFVISSIFCFCIFLSDLEGNSKEPEEQKKISNKIQKLSQWDFSLWDACSSKELKSWILSGKKEKITDHLLLRKNEIDKDDCSIAKYETDFSYYGNESLGLLFTIARRGLKIYVNDVFIHETRPFNNKDISPPIVSKSDVVFIPANLLKQGTNKLTVKTSALDGWIGLMINPQIGPLEIIKKKYLIELMWFGALSSILLFLSLFYLFHFYKRQKEKYYLYFASLCFFSFFWILGFTGIGLFLIDSQLAYIICIYFCGILVFPCNISFFHSFLKIPFGIIVRVINGIYLTLAVIFLIEYVLTGGIKFFNTYLYDPFIMSMLPVTLYLYYLSIKGIILKRPYSKQILLGVIIYSMSLFYSMFQFLGYTWTNFSIANQLFVEGIFFMALVFAWVLVSEFAKVHTLLEETHEELLVLNTMKDEFLATTSHELRTPLHGIIGLADSMLETSGKELSAAQRGDVDLMRKSARRLNNLVDEILDFSKLRAGKTDLYIGEVDMRQIIPSVVSIARGLVGKKNIEISYNSDPELYVITGDRNRIEQILLNLLSNAVKFTDEGLISVSAQNENNGIYFSVKDTGRGMDRTEIRRIWNPYEQGRESEHSSGGTGLGLAICRHLVDLHGGTIKAESDKGKGSVFTVWLPVEPPAHKTGIIKTSNKTGSITLPALIPSDYEQAEIETRAHKSSDSGELIIVVDDDPINLKIIERLLSRKGYRIKAYQKGKEALEAIEIERPHLVLLDLMLPEMSGYDIILEIRKQYGQTFLPVIMITARNQIEDMVKGFVFGCNDYLTKPFNHKELLVRVENQLVMKNIFDMDMGLRSDSECGINAEDVTLLQRSRLFKETVSTLKDWENIISRDLDISKSFLDRLIGIRVNRTDLDIHVFFDPLLAIGGDLYLAHSLDDGRIRIFMADATGHGINASLNCITIMSEYNILRDNNSSPGEILSTLNNRFCQILKEQFIIFPCCIADIYPDDERLVFASAGHPQQAVISPDGVLNLIKPKGVIIGLMKNMQYENLDAAFKKGSILAFFSDGLIENYSNTKVSPDKIHDEKFFYDLLVEYRNSESMDTMSEKIISSMKGFGRKKEIDNDDDMTLILLKYKI